MTEHHSCFFCDQRRRLLQGAALTLALPVVGMPLAYAEGVEVGGNSVFSKLASAESVEQTARAQYQQTLQQALREVSDALVGVRKRQEFRQQQELLVKALADASEVANMRYEGGVSSYLEVIDTERQYFDAELDLVQARRDESQSVIQLYKALGGGWNTDPTTAVAAR